MTKLIYAFFGILILLVITVVAVPLLIPADTITRQLVTAVKENTGRDLTIGGTPEFSIFPSIALGANEVSLSNPGGAEAGSLVSMGEMQVKLALMPLIRGEIDVKQFVLTKPVVTLQVDNKGVANWQFDQTGGSPGAAGTSDGSSSGSSPSISQVRLGDIRVIDGTVSYADARTGETTTVTGINIALALPDLSSPLDATGSAIWNDEKMDLTVNLGSLQALMDGQSTDLTTAVASKFITVDFKGAIASAGGFGMNGAIQAKSPSVRGLAGWTGSPLAPGNGLGPFSVGAKMKFKDDALTLSDAKLALDGMKANGNAIVELGGARPLVRASLGVDRIDINQYLAEGDEGGGDAGGESSDGPAATGWSDDKIDFTGLSALDANLKLAAAQILFRDIKIGKSALSVAINGGKLSAKLTELALYNGQAKGAVTLDGARKTPALAAAFSVSAIDARSLLKDAIKMKWLEGTGNLSLDLAASGASQRQMVSTLGGKANFEFLNGAIRGVNIPQMLRSLGSNPLSGWQSGDAQKTDFSSLTASYTIAKGVATNTDLAMVGPLVRITGGGTIDMPEQSVDYRVKPKLVGSLEGQGGALDITGLGVDVIISGAWASPKIYPDIKGILDNPEAAYKSLKGIGKGVGKALKKGKAKKVLKDILKTPGKAVDDATQGTKDDDPIGNVLKKLF